MTETRPTPLETAMGIFLNTTRSAIDMQVDMHQAEREAAGSLQQLKRFGGKFAVQQYMHGKPLDIESIGEAAKLLVVAGLSYVGATALRNGVDGHLKAELKQADSNIAELLDGVRLEARPVEGVLTRAVIGASGPTGTRHYDIPEAGVEGIFYRADTAAGHLYLHSNQPDMKWQLEPYDRYNGFGQQVTLDILPPVA